MEHCYRPVSPRTADMIRRRTDARTRAVLACPANRPLTPRPASPRTAWDFVSDCADSLGPARVFGLAAVLGAVLAAVAVLW